jgi:predicted enzyme related to lactoylglutathione lyase
MTDTQPADPNAVDIGLKRPNGLSYLHIPALDVRAAAVFYGSVFEWQLTNLDSPRPGFVDGTGHLAGAWVADQAVAAEPGLLPYIYVADIDDTAARITAEGGTIVKAPYPEGNLRVATFRDPAGNVLGLWQEVEH